jgi:hypothetical protein
LKNNYDRAESTQSCWCIRVDLHPLGLMPAADEKFDASFIDYAELKSFFTGEIRTDLRKGDLFALIESLQSKRQEEGD